MAAAVERGTYTDEERVRMVREFENRGADVSGAQVAKKLGVSVALLYSWRKRIRDGQPLDMRTHRTVASTAITTAPKTRRMPAHEIVISPKPQPPAPTTGPLTDHERDELVRLRAEVVRLKAAIVAGLIDDSGDHHG